MHKLRHNFISIFLALGLKKMSLTSDQLEVGSSVHGCWVSNKIAIYTAAVPEPIQLYTRPSCGHVKSLITRQPFKSQIGYIHWCGVYTKFVIYTAAVQEPNQLYILLPGVYIKFLFTWQLFKSEFQTNSILLGVHIQCLFTQQ